ncbi:MAG: hypothetical protein OSB62_04690 [Alphaproteobacteria bacterium]|nr:hypothetical protein [Alphaproteobacteria bacterium]
MQTQKKSLTDKGLIGFVKLGKLYVDNPYWAAVPTILFLGLALGLGAWATFPTYLTAMWGVHYIGRHMYWNNHYYHYKNPERMHYIEVSGYAGWGIVVAGVATVASAIIVGIYYKHGLNDNTWLFFLPLGVLVLYDWLFALPEEIRPTLLERAKTRLDTLDKKLNKTQGD